MRSFRMRFAKYHVLQGTFRFPSLNMTAKKTAEIEKKGSEATTKIFTRNKSCIFMTTWTFFQVEQRQNQST